jgi:hypothetical protein
MVFEQQKEILFEGFQILGAFSWSKTSPRRPPTIMPKLTNVGATAWKYTENRQTHTLGCLLD